MLIWDIFRSIAICYVMTFIRMYQLKLKRSSNVSYFVFFYARQISLSDFKETDKNVLFLIKLLKHIQKKLKEALFFFIFGSTGKLQEVQ